MHGLCGNNNGGAVTRTCCCSYSFMRPGHMNRGTHLEYTAALGQHAQIINLFFCSWAASAAASLASAAIGAWPA